MLRENEKNLAVKLTEKQIEVYETMLGYVPAIIETVRRYDGKQVTKRIETALQDIARGIHFAKNPYSNCWELTVTEYDNRSVQGDADSYGYHSSHYIQDDKLYLADSYRDRAFVTDDGKLIAEKLITQIEEKAKDYRASVNEMKEQLARIDSIIAAYDTIKKAERDFMASVDCRIRDYFSLDLKL